MASYKLKRKLYFLGIGNMTTNFKGGINAFKQGNIKQGFKNTMKGIGTAGVYAAGTAAAASPFVFNKMTGGDVNN